MQFKPTALLAIIFATTTVIAQECPEIPDSGVEFGSEIPPNPDHIPAGCSDYEILVGKSYTYTRPFTFLLHLCARGTSEPNAPGGKFGVVVGDPIVTNTTLALEGIRGYPVQYPASSSVILGGIRGSNDVVARLIRQSLLCPDQTFALVGYSQGAGVMHKAAAKLPVYFYPKIKSLVMFGDPTVRFSNLNEEFPDELKGKVLQNCAEGDPVCDPNAGGCNFWHLTYIRREWVDRAVDFIVNAFLGTPLPPSGDIGLE